MKKVAFYTLGCKVNQYETEAIIELFEKDGYHIRNFEDYADVYVINTCTVTNLSDRKSRQMIRRAKRLNKKARIAVIGCYAQVASEKISNIEGVNLIIGTNDRGRIIEFINQLYEDNNKQINLVQDIMKVKDFEQLQITDYKERTRAFLKIQEGCNQFCSYCIIPYARGPIRSREPEKIIHEVEILAKGGFKEVVLTGIHIASYGKDFGDIGLLDIIKKVHNVSGIQRIRLGSIEPRFIAPDFISSIIKLPKFCDHYHISLQSGCDETLKRMNRKYTTDDYRQVVYNLRKNFPNVAITTDIMVGFPGETKDEFKQSLAFVDEISFSHVHVFKYSAREGTPAAKYPNQVSSQEKEERSKIMIELVEKNEKKFYEGFIGKTVEVLFEQQIKDKEGYYEGLTSNYIKIVSYSDKNIEGKLATVELEEIKEGLIMGTIKKILDM